MVSLAYLITTLFILVAVSRGKDVTSAKGDINAKWFYMGVSAFVPFTTWNWSWYTVWPFGFNSFFGGTLFPSTFSMFFAKAVDEAHSVSRRTISLDDHEPLFRRDLPQTVTCYDEKGSPQQFYTADCAAAAQILHSQNFHTAHSGSCQLSLVTTQNKVYAKDLPEQTINNALESILKNCAQGQKTSSSQPQPVENQVMMVLSKP
ncbi:hypothetical protein PCANC_04236 [Puccinia coronata f. sp. avenae]|uniref:Uncharacterized protein n=1 Tax=Puccinia coronata f. sp. avenae TaxID=200324 RepID=A0A2N5VX70_9BASI|nr:hypothetical protein PCANC_04236 [Puccinia coronata f. sp. avenae]